MKLGVALGQGGIPSALIFEALADWVPFGKLMKKVKGAYSTVKKGAIGEAKEAMEHIVKANGKHLTAEGLGEAGAIIAAQAKNFKATDFPSRYHGIDSIWRDGDKLIIVEAKGGASALGKTVSDGQQMSRNWIEAKIAKLRKSADPVDKKWGEDLYTASTKPGGLEAMVVKTPHGGVPEFEHKTWSELGVDPTVF